MAKTAAAISLYAFGTLRGGSRTSSARLDTVSTPVYASIATGIAMAKSFHVGATPQRMFDVRISGLKTRTKPITTRSAWVAKSTTARKTLTRAASWTPTMLTATSRTTTTAPPTMSQGFSFSGSQKTER